jgi:hypothetical protein
VSWHALSCALNHSYNTVLYSIGYSKKGWTDGEIGALWIKQFDEQTCDKANGRTRLLLVDGHNSHYTRAFLEYARQHRIHVLCYPAHSTHIYQGLDVAVFGVLKQCWSEERDKWEREKGEKVTKSNFLAIYGAAHIRALTSETIKSAFRKTGVWPFNPKVVTDEMLAPARESSNQGHLPITPESPVRAIIQLLRDLQPRAETRNCDIQLGTIAEEDGSINDETTPGNPHCLHFKDQINNLSNSRREYLREQ